MVVVRKEDYKMLRTEWAHIHNVVQHCSQPALGRVVESGREMCHVAGKCMCDPKGKALQAFVHQLRMFVKQACKENDELKLVADKSELCLALSSAINLDKRHGVHNRIPFYQFGSYRSLEG